MEVREIFFWSSCLVVHLGLLEILELHSITLVEREKVLLQFLQTLLCIVMLTSVL